jgi:outer membrane protein assembly factor BamB
MLQHYPSREELLEHEWSSHSGNGNGPGLTNFATGPAPDSFDVLWKYRGTGCRFRAAFGGYLFIEHGGEFLALDPWTGEEVYAVPGLGGMTIKIDDTYMLVGSSMVRIDDGSILWSDNSWHGTFKDTPGQRSTGSQMSYDPENKLMWVSPMSMWSFEDPTQPPTLVWNQTDVVDGWIGYRNYACIGDGKVFQKKPGIEIIAFDEFTGDIIWRTPTKGTVMYQSLYYDGKFIAGSLSGDVICLDGETGEYLWTFNPGGYWNFWASWPAAAYGLYFEQNFDGYLYAIDVNTGKCVWKYKGPGNYYPQGPTVADYKVYLQIGTRNYRDPATWELGWDESVCLDALTGEVLYSVNVEHGQPYVAYGNAYLDLSQQNQSPKSFHGHSGKDRNEIWCITSQPQDWAMYGKDPSNSFIGAGPRDLALEWQFETGAAVTASPSVAQGVVYVGSLDYNIYALDAYNGEEIWSFETGYQVKSSVAVVDGRVYTGVDDGNAYCLDAATGNVIWQTHVLDDITRLSQNYGPQTRSSPKVVDGRIYVGAIDGNLYCLDTSDGDIIYTFDAGDEILCSPAVVDGEVYFHAMKAGDHGTFYKLRASDAAVIWTLDLPYLRGGSRFAGPGGGDISAAPNVQNGAIYQAWDGGNEEPGMGGLYKIDAATGEIIWNAPTYWTRDTVIGYAPMIYYEGYPRWVSTLPPGTIGEDGREVSYSNRNLDYDNAKFEKQDIVLYNDLFYRVIALNATDGSYLWCTYVGRETYGFAFSEPNQLYAACEAKVLYNFDSESGDKISYYEPPAQTWSNPALYDGKLYTGGQDWFVRCYGEAQHDVIYYGP